METLSFRDTLVLESDTFSLYGRQVNALNWYEFDTSIGGKTFKNIGGGDYQITLSRLIDILSKQQGKPLSEIKNARYRELIGGEETEYVGYFVVSGYNTFYFFKLGGHLKHVVFADKHGNLLAHSELQPDLANTWLEQLVQLQAETGCS